MNTTGNYLRPSEQDNYNQTRDLDQGERADMVSNPTLVGDQAPLQETDTVVFASEGNLNAVRTSNYASSEQQLGVVSDTFHTIEQMLMRPIKLPKVIDFNDTFVEFGFLTEYLKNDMVKALLRPYASMTCTYCVKVVTNSQPTQSGMAILAASPSRTALTGFGGHDSYNVPLKSMGAYPKQVVPFLSGLQNVVMNLASTSASVLKIPYVGVRSLNEMTELTDTSFYYHNIVPLKSGTSGEKLTVQIYTWLENLQLVGTSSGEPTVAPWVGIHSKNVEKPTPGPSKSAWINQEIMKALVVTDTTDDNNYVMIQSSLPEATLPNTFNKPFVTKEEVWEALVKEYSVDGVTQGVLRIMAKTESLRTALISMAAVQEVQKLKFSTPPVPLIWAVLEDRVKLEASTVQDYFGVVKWSTTATTAYLQNLQQALRYFGKEWEFDNSLPHKEQLTFYRQIDIDAFKQLVHVSGSALKYQSGGAYGKKRDELHKPKRQMDDVEEAEKVGKEAKGWKFSDVSSLVGTIAGYAAKVPVLADFALPVQWAANEAADVARFFGYSKPHDVRGERPMVQKPWYHFAHGAGVSTATKLTMNPDQGIQLTSLGPEKEDEMALSYILRRPGLYFDMTWKKTDIVGTTLFQDPMIPSRFYIGQKYTVANAGAGVGVRFNTHLSYLSDMFMFYLGSLNLTFNFAATKFHSGRLRFVYVPQMPKPTLANDSWTPAQLTQIYQNQNVNYHCVVDLRDANTFTLEVPYVASQPYLPNEMDLLTSVPAMFCFVEVPLVGPANVADTVSAWISVSGGDDFKFIGPRMNSRTKLLPFGTGILSAPVGGESKFSAVETSKHSVEEKFAHAAAHHSTDFTGLDKLKFPANQFGQPIMKHRYQGFTRTETSSVKPAKIQMCAGVPPRAPTVAQMMSVGDVVESLRMLIKRPSEAVMIGVGSQSEDLNFINPWMNTTLTGEKYESETFFQRIRALYRFSAGSVVVSGIGLPAATHRFKLADLTSLAYWKDFFVISGNGTSGFNNVIGGKGVKAVDQMSLIPHVAESLHNPVLEGMFSYSLPFYNTYDKVDNMLLWSNGSNKEFNYVPQFAPPLALVWPNPTIANSNQSLYLAADEDFNCGFLNGPPITFERVIG